MNSTPDNRSLDWLVFIGPDASFDVMGGPEWFRDQLMQRRAAGGSRALATWDIRAKDLPTLEQYSTLVTIRPRDISTERLRAAGFLFVQRFAICPSLANARWYIPLDSRAIAAAAFAMFTPFRRAAKAKRFGVGWAARLGLPGWYRDEMIVAQRQKPGLIRTLEGTVSADDSLLALATGTVGPTRTPSIAIMTSQGDVRAIAKVAGTAVTKRLLANEAACLHVLERDERTRAIAPRLLRDIDTGDLRITVQRAIPGSLTGSSLTAEHLDFLGRLARNRMVPALSTAMAAGFAERIASIRRFNRELRNANDLIQVLLQSTMIPKTIAHGDFAPWNLRRHAGSISAFDWENAELDGLPFLDLIHHELQSGILIHDWSHGRVEGHLAARRSEPHPLYCASELTGFQLSYLLEMLLRRCEEGRSDDDRFIAIYRHLACRLTTDSELGRQ